MGGQKRNPPQLRYPRIRIAWIAALFSLQSPWLHASTLHLPPTLHALEADHDDGLLSAQNPTDVSSLRPSQLEGFVKGVSFHLSDKELFCIEKQDVFDRAYSEDEIWNREVIKCEMSITCYISLSFDALLLRMVIYDY
ncbi:hypothetical protein RHSIM_Rhsim06G0100000 [Rhododendron simsii]|uniref:Uncharacterized protein n=1 Tax=Rhododendron simsii TaxID=118357 RepID=A0A834GV16_RHOSS|nr:hypothetical protein RHSIM_Rhsim06G0100000 [Rhododendron simsii]